MNVVESSKSTLSDLHLVISQLDEQEYSRPLSILSNSSIGMHARHILEFYNCAMDHENEINYDKRQRDLTVQSSISKFDEVISHLIDKLSKISDEKLAGQVMLTNDEEGSVPVQSSLAREIQYNIEHTIHHSALLKIGILSLGKAIDIPETFGVAPSTLRYQAK